jgi:hypothetical protein
MGDSRRLHSASREDVCIGGRLMNDRQRIHTDRIRVLVLIGLGAAATWAIAFSTPIGITGRGGFVAEAQERFDIITRSSPAPGTDVIRIDRPNVKQRSTEYRSITFRPGDTVTLDAGGCVQTGGTGKTWKRYVNPSGPNSDRLYHGLIWIPGATSGLVRVQGVMGRPLQVAPGTAAAQSFLRLGYEDDKYSDNGYWGHDDGTEDQCKDNTPERGGPAHVTLTIRHAAQTVPDPAPFDVVWDQVDDNGIPLNPEWGFQKTHPGQFPGSGLCGPPWLAPCTTQAPSTDTAFLCGSSGSLGGHANWGPATYEGPILWNSHSTPGTDDDYNIDIITPGNAGYTENNTKDIHTEFDSDETIDHFRTQFWDAFHHAVDGDSTATPESMINNKFGIIIGLMGLDCAHSCGSEIHPVWAMAIHIKDDPADDIWAMFIRNWGDEGFCGDEQHYLDLSNIVFRLPWRPGATRVLVKNANFLTNDTRCSGPGVTQSPGVGVGVSFGLPAPESQPRIHGELHLTWTVPAGGAIRTPLPTAAFQARALAGPQSSEEKDDLENRFADLVGRMSPAQKQEFMAVSAKSAATQDSQALRAAPSGPQLKGRARISSLRFATAFSTVPRVRAVPNPQKTTRDRQRLNVLHKAFGPSIPGIRN